MTLNDHWRFTLELYRATGVAPACLALQDAFDVNVNLLLFGLYASGRLGRALSEPEIEQASAQVKAVRERLVLPLRSSRRAAKNISDLGGPDLETGEKLYQALKRVEVMAEHVEQQILDHWLAGLPAAPAERAGDAAILHETARRIIEQARMQDDGCAQPLDAQQTAAVNLIADAAADVAERLSKG